jgi:cytochrome b
VRLKYVFWLDASLLFLFCALEVVPFTGLLLHEWVGLAVVPMIVVHLLLSWTWIASSTRGLVRSPSWRGRVNYLLNLLLFASVTAVVYSGILISQDAVPAMTGKTAIRLDGIFSWRYVHNRSANLVLFLAGMHLAMNWTWSVAAARKILAFGSEIRR